MVEQNLTLCFLMSAMAGFLTISARAVVLKQVEREKKGLSANTTFEKHISSILFFLLEGSAHVLSFLGPWFGPASLILPACGSSKLLFNVLIVGAILQHEKFDKKALVGTAIVAIGVIYLPIIGPRPQENQDLIELIVKDPVSLIWLGTAVVGYVISVGIMLCCDLKKFTPRTAETILLLVSTFSTLGNTVSKASSLAAAYGGIYRGLLLGIGFFTSLIWIIEKMKEPMYVRSFASFIPLDTVVGLLFNLCTGLIVWNDGLTVSSWAGYIIAYVLMSLGVYLISDIDFLVKQGKDLQNYQEIVLADIYHPYATIFDNRAVDQQQQQQLSRAQLEMNMSRHQLTILDHTRRQGLKRGNSDPEIQSPSTRISLLGLDESSRSALRFEGFHTESGHFSLYGKRESISSISRPAGDSQIANKTTESDESHATGATASDWDSSPCQSQAPITSAPTIINWMSRIRHSMGQLFGVSHKSSLSSVPTTLSVVECKLQDPISKEPARSRTMGSWDCEVGGELTDHISTGSTVSAGSIGQQNDEWVCDEDDDNDEIYEA